MGQLIDEKKRLIHQLTRQKYSSIPTRNSATKEKLSYDHKRTN